MAFLAISKADSIKMVSTICVQFQAKPKPDKSGKNRFFAKQVDPEKVTQWWTRSLEPDPITGTYLADRKARPGRTSCPASQHTATPTVMRPHPRVRPGAGCHRATASAATAAAKVAWAGDFVLRRVEMLEQDLLVKVA